MKKSRPFAKAKGTAEQLGFPRFMQKSGARNERLRVALGSRQNRASQKSGTENEACDLRGGKAFLQRGPKSTRHNAQQNQNQYKRLVFHSMFSPFPHKACPSYDTKL